MTDRPTVGQTIRVLDPVTASRIAAGEVVERPSSVVKELLENSLDAGADEIEVEIQSGGRRLIRVTDNGCGIASDQLEAAMARHGTSKIRDSADLERVSTLGFRGEALASIASVSHLTIRTRSSGAQAATQLAMENGRALGRSQVAAPIGTSVTVEHLFRAVPARLKFLKTDPTESGHVLDLVVRYALVSPNKRFSLTRDGRSAFRSSGSGELEDVLVAAFGLDAARQLISLPSPASAEGNVEDRASSVDAIGVRGFVSPPHLHRATRRSMTLFVNGRWVQDSQLSYAVTSAYHGLLPKGRYPVTIVVVELPVTAVDVNVHPAKTQVRFRDASAVFSTVNRAVRSAVVGQAPVPRWRETPPVPGRWRAPEHGRPVTGGVAERHVQSTFDEGSPHDLPMLRVVGQVAQAYIVAEGPEGLYLIDQHAAHERVMYEAFMTRSWKCAAQRILAPEPVVVSPIHMGAIEEHRRALADVGFDIEAFGADTVLVRAMPEVLTSTDVAGTLNTVLDLTMEDTAPAEEAFEARLVRAVCKRATVKAGQTLSMEEMRSLVLQLERTSSPRTCPHGRPTTIVLSGDQLAREFGRS